MHLWYSFTLLVLFISIADTFPLFFGHKKKSLGSTKFSSKDGNSSGNLKLHELELNQTLVGASGREYLILEKLGSGGFGSIYFAKGKRSSTKLIVKSPLEDPSFFLREISIQKLIHHWPKNEQRYFGLMTDYNSHNNPPWYSMLYYERGDLLARLKHTLLTDSQIQSIMKSLLTGLKILHKHDLVHRDIKLENLVISDTITKLHFPIKIIDFGLMELADRLRGTVGTEYSMAPEVYYAYYPIGTPSDIWSAGVILLILHENKDVYEVNIPADVPFSWEEEAQHRCPSYKLMIDCNTYKTCMCSLLRRMLVINPNHRLTASEALEHKFFSLNYNKEVINRDD